MAAPWRFALSPAVDDKETRTAAAELCALLSADAGHDIEPLIVASPEELSEALGSGHAPFAWVSPTLLLSPELAMVVPLLSSVREGQAFFHSVIFAAPSSAVRKLDDLRGVRAAWVAPTSASGYLVPRLSLAQRGVDLAAAFSSERFLGSHGAVAVAVMRGLADVGATFAHFERGIASGTMVRSGYDQIQSKVAPHVLFVTGPIPADMIVAHPEVPLTARVAFAAALSRMPIDPLGAAHLAKVIGAEDFRPVTIAALEELARLTAASVALRAKT
jgi:phosphonate transport system substrate-binding protein